MNTGTAETRIKGKTIKVPSVHIDGRTVIATGKWLKMAAVQDEDFLEGPVLDEPAVFVSRLKEGGLGADVFTFREKLPEVKAKPGFHSEWESLAAIPITTYEDWWERRVSHNLRTDVKRSKKRGVVARLSEFNDEFVRGIVEIYNETPVRQGRPFWHYRKDFETIKRETATYQECSHFVGAYLDNELIGFIKIVRVDNLGCLMQIISKVAHQDKRPTNALIAKAVEVCAEKKYSFLTYGKFRYGKTENSLSAFKRRNGFEEILVPRYYVPLTLRGKIALRLGLHHGVTALIPSALLTFLIRSRAWIYQRLPRSRKPEAGVVDARHDPQTGPKAPGSEEAS